MPHQKSYLQMRKYRILFLILGLAFIYCWAKFYTFYEGTAQGLYGSTSKGDFFFYFELLLNFIVIAYFICSIFFSLKISKNNTPQQNKRLFLPAFIFLLLGLVYGTLSYEDYEVNIFTYLANNYELWRFLSDNFLMEYLILTLVSVPVFVFQLIRYYLWKRL